MSNKSSSSGVPIAGDYSSLVFYLGRKASHGNPDTDPLRLSHGFPC